jgi:hypothetical protein
MDELEKEYNYILDFLEKAIESCEYNIVNHINKSLTRKTLVLENGELSILEKESVRCIWSREDQSFYYESDVNVSLELINRICYIRIREGLIEYWKEITGETLREHFYDNKTNLNQSLQLLEKLQENK